MTKRIAVIDDDAATRAMLTAALTHAGDLPHVFPSLDDARPFLYTHPPAVLLLDLRFDPPHDGWHVLAQVQADPSLAALPLVVSSTNHQALRTGAPFLAHRRLTVLPKPFDLAVLQDALAAAR